MPRKIDGKAVLIGLIVGLGLSTASAHLIEHWQEIYTSDDVGEQFYLNQRFAILGFLCRGLALMLSGYIAGRSSKGDALDQALLVGVIAWVVLMVPYAGQHIALQHWPQLVTAMLAVPATYFGGVFSQYPKR